MENLTQINKYIQRSKITKLTLKKICYFFSKDYTASKTALNTKLSRETINTYYKILRFLLLKQEDINIQDFLKEAKYHNESLNIKCIKPLSKNQTEIIYFIELKKRVFILDKEESFLNISHFLNSCEKETVFNQRINCIKVLFNQHSNNYLIVKHLNTANELNEFTTKRLKKFRGLNKKSILDYVKESQIRFSCTNAYIYNTLVPHFD